MSAFHAAFIAAVISVAATGAATAQTTLEKLGQFKTIGATDFAYVEQGGSKAAAIRKTLRRIEMPAGFKIDLYAIVPNARHMAGLGTSSGSQWTVRPSRPYRRAKY